MGFTPEQAITKLRLGDAKGVSAVDRLAALETGEIEPTRPLLVKMAKQYRRPLLAFYMSAPPRRGERGQDFRTVQADDFSETNALLDVLIRNVNARQGMVRLSDEIAPFIVINDQDSRAAWSFTLLHELTHLWLGQTGISGARAVQVIEQFCNDVAGQFLLPAEELGELDVDDSTNLELSMSRVSEFATHRNLSASLVAYKLFRVGAIGGGTWNHLSTAFRGLWFEQRSDQREKARTQEGGPDYYVVRRHRVGTALISLASRAIADGSMTTSQAGRVLGVKAKNVHQLLGSAAPGAGSLS